MCHKSSKRFKWSQWANWIKDPVHLKKPTDLNDPIKPRDANDPLEPTDLIK